MTTRKTINPETLGSARVPLSHGVKVGNVVYVSGTTPFKPGTREMAPDFEGQMRQVMTNIGTILAAAGSAFERVVKVNVILVDIGNFKKMNEIYRTYFKEGDFPARTTIEAKLATPGMMLEIECVAEVGA
jgi:2-iminobutanoate/2-iminopropanoate deaminase